MPSPSALGPVDRVLRSVAAAPNERWTVARMARLAAVSRPVLARLFHRQLGAPPMRAVARVRLEKAAALLAASDAPLAAIADAVGYRSEFAFNRAFKRHHGIAPGRYRAHTRIDGAFRMAA